MGLLRKIFGGKAMAALTVGIKAPDFALTTLDGKAFSLSEQLASGPVVLAFFKVSCPTCQYAFPFLERLHQVYGNHAHGNHGAKLIGISQNDAQKTKAFLQEFGITFPVLMDELDRYPVSNAYGLTNVPTLFWIAADGEIEVSSVGWMKKEFEDINRKMAAQSSAPAAPIFQPGEDVRDFRAG